MTGFTDGHAAVEFYKGAWILRAALPGDRPLTESAEAASAMEGYRARARERMAHARAVEALRDPGRVQGDNRGGR